jgi:hypothetical protein
VLITARRGSPQLDERMAFVDVGETVPEGGSRSKWAATALHAAGEHDVVHRAAVKVASSR